MHKKIGKIYCFFGWHAWGKTYVVDTFGAPGYRCHEIAQDCLFCDKHRAIRAATDQYQMSRFWFPIILEDHPELSKQWKEKYLNKENKQDESD